MDIDKESFTQFVYKIMKQEAHDLLEISSYYETAAETGFYNDRRHDKALAAIFAREFAVRSDEVDIMADYLLKQMKNYNGETNGN